MLAVLVYSLGSTLYDFLTRLFISQYRYPYLAPLALAQVLLTLLCTVALRALGCVTLQPYSLQLGERLLVPSICSSLQAVLGLWAEANAPSDLFVFMLQLLPLASAGWSHVLGLTKPPSPRITALVTAVTLSALISTGMHGSFTWKPLVYLYAPLSLLLHSLCLSWLAKVGELQRRHAGGQTSPLDLYYTLSVNSSLLLGFLCLLLPNAGQAFSRGSWHSLIFLGYLLGMTVLGALQHLFLALATLYSSPLAAALLHAAKDLALLFYSLL
uniref:Si:ch211-207n2.7 n=1 Tax=Lepisosteus oculatus TaxID=7918 RepID=W5MPP4_LEPOC